MLRWGSMPPPVVSFEDEPLVLVDSDDRVVGHDSKAAVHSGEGRLHRAFSVFLFDRDGRVLLQQRSPHKRLWPGYWSNACCSHPRRAEEVEGAALRRLREELAVVPGPLRFLFKFEYHARFGDSGSEHELCWVYAATCRSPPDPNPHEIAALRVLSPEELDRELASRGAEYTPWLHLEWAAMRTRHWPAVTSIVDPGGTWRHTWTSG